MSLCVRTFDLKLLRYIMMADFYIVFIIALLIVAYCDVPPLCPISSRLNVDTGSNKYFNYPIDVFESLDAAKWEQSSSLSCQAYDIAALDVVRLSQHVCPKSARMCPVIKQNIHDSVAANSHLARSSICVLHKTLMNRSKTINMYVSGGSVTQGGAAQGCCESPECQLKVNRGNCSWAYHLHQWMNNSFPAQVNHVNIAEGGFSSEIAMGNLKKIMNRRRLAPFTSNDVIFLDHSVNDNHIGTASSVGPALEGLVRYVYQCSEPHDWPTVIVLAGDPQLPKKSEKYSYFDVYENISSYYHIPLWSYRSAVLSNHSRTVQSNYSKYLTFDGNKAGDVHPPWYVHLFMADLYADILTSEITKYCGSDSPMMSKLFQENMRLRNRTMADLPDPLSDTTTIVECDNIVLDIDYDSIVKQLPLVGSYELLPAVGGWRVDQDEPGRSGGFIVNSSSVSGSKVIFRLNITTKDFIAMKKELHLVVGYLRTYENAGLAQIRFCGVSITTHDRVEGTLDSLWTDRDFKYSLPYKWSPRPSDYSYQRCESFLEEHPTVELIFKNPKEPQRGTQKFKMFSITACTV